LYNKEETTYRRAKERKNMEKHKTVAEKYGKSKRQQINVCSTNSSSPGREGKLKPPTQHNPGSHPDRLAYLALGQ
jgi:hypothetical protein